MVLSFSLKTFDVVNDPAMARLFVWISIPYAAMLGSFLNMAIYRVPRRISMWKKTRSFCPQCEETIRWRHNIPIVSYLLLLGKCAYCRKPIPLRYLIVEILSTLGIMLIAYYTLELNPEKLGWLGLLLIGATWLSFLALIIVDFEMYLIPDLFTHIPLALGLATAWFLPDLHYGRDPWFSESVRAAASSNAVQFNSVIDSAMGAVFGALMIWSLGAIGMLWKKVEAMGEGDVLLMAAIGSIVGWKLVLINIVLACIVGAIFGGAGIIVAKLRTGTAEKTITFEETAESMQQKELIHIRLIRKLGTRWIGMILACVFGACWLIMKNRIGHFEQGSFVAEMHPLTMTPFILSTIMGAFMVLFSFVKDRMEKEGVLQRNIEEAEDGSVKEELTGNYIPFGPALAICGMLIILWGPVIMETAAKHYLKNKKYSAPLKTVWTPERNEKLYR